VAHGVACSAPDLYLVSVVQTYTEPVGFTDQKGAQHVQFKFGWLWWCCQDLGAWALHASPDDGAAAQLVDVCTLVLA
jgi:hypothetical protein